ncbi:NERD domain-containing protein [Streptomyces olivoreticuli]|uniref:NERD domain-containing protein n=1 Tax=Streptomyces olivoreticuli TaxID=68246 RepID=UPI000E2258A2
MREGRWTTVTESGFVHERSGLDAIREQLPDSDPWRAWSNFTFTANSGHVREVDLLVVALGGVFLIELKNWYGSVTSENRTWVQTTREGHRRAHGNPLHLANKKAKELAGLLRNELKQHGKRVWVGEAVCFTDDALCIRLPAHDLNGVHTITELVEMLKRPPRDERHRITAVESREIKSALERVSAVLPQRLAVATVAARLADFEGARAVLAEPARFHLVPSA